MSSKFLYIPTSGQDPEAVKPLVAFVQDLESRKSLVSKAYPRKLESLQNLVYSHQKDDDILRKQLDDEIKNQLRHDQDFFLKHQKEQDQTLRTLIQDTVQLKSEGKGHLNDGNQQYKSVKSDHNQLDVALLPHHQPGNYLVSLNHKCVTVGGNYQYGLAPCNPYSNSQRFQLDKIDDDESYFGQYSVQPNPNTVNPSTYPFSLLKSSLNGACLESQDDGLYLKPCKDIQTQKWTPSTVNKMSCHQK